MYLICNVTSIPLVSLGRQELLFGATQGSGSFCVAREAPFVRCGM